MIRPNGIVMPCSLTPDALSAIAGDDLESPHWAFIVHRDRIEAVASAKYDRRQIDPDGDITLGSTEFQR